MTDSSVRAARVRPVFGELTAKSAAAMWPGTATDGLPEHILRSEGFAGGGAAGLFALYEEMEQKDGHLFSVLQTRKNGVLGRGRQVVPASGSERDRKVARFVERTLGGLRDFDRAMAGLLDALGKGVAVVEILWAMRDGEVVPEALRSRAPGRFTRGRDGSLRLADFAVGAQADGGRQLPERKFLELVFGGLYENPYGVGLCARTYWYYWFKKHNLKFWMLYNEKFGSPTVVGKYRPGATEDDRDQLFEVVQSLQQDTGVTIPESMTLELLEARRSGNATTYESLAEWCNAEISKVVLGATLTSGEGREHGTQALGTVHDRVRSDYVSADARMLEGVVNGQLVRWLVDFNFGVDVAAPRWQIDTSRDDRLEREINLDKELVGAGVALPVRYFYEKYGRPAPADNEAALRFDDQNLFQYHLRYGVLTVNEARARLGMGPVEWGDRPTQMPNVVGEAMTVNDVRKLLALEPVSWGKQRLMRVEDKALPQSSMVEERGDPSESELEKEDEEEPREL